VQACITEQQFFFAFGPDLDKAGRQVQRVDFCSVGYLFEQPWFVALESGARLLYTMGNGCFMSPTDGGLVRRVRQRHLTL